jgi:putative endonuclease
MAERGNVVLVMLRWLRRRPKTRQELALIGEEHAARFLRSKGYRVRERNFRARGGEVDIVAEHGDALVFVEVKARSSTDFADPRESVTPGKQKRIARAAAVYIARRERRERVTRFDVVEVLVTPEGRVERVNVIEGAFGA